MADERVTHENYPVELHNYKLEELKNKQENHEERIKSLEENKTEIRLEFANMKQSYSDLKSLVLELNSKQSDKIDKHFSKMIESQTTLTNQILSVQSIKENNKYELSGKKLALIGTLITVGGGIITSIVSHFVK